MAIAVALTLSYAAAAWSAALYTFLLHLPMDSPAEQPAAHSRHRSILRTDLPHRRRLNGRRIDNRRLRHGRGGRPSERSGETFAVSNPRALPDRQIHHRHQPTALPSFIFQLAHNA